MVKHWLCWFMLIHVDHFTGTLWLHLNFCGARQKPGAFGRFAAPFSGLADPTGLPLRIRGSLQSFQSSEMMPDTQVFQVFQIVSKRFFLKWFFDNDWSEWRWIQRSSDPVTQWCYAIFICAVRGVALSTSGNAWVVPRDHGSGHASSDTCSCPY